MNLFRRSPQTYVWRTRRTERQHFSDRGGHGGGWAGLPADLRAAGAGTVRPTMRSRNTRSCRMAASRASTPTLVFDHSARRCRRRSPVMPTVPLSSATPGAAERIALANAARVGRDRRSCSATATRSAAWPTARTSALSRQAIWTGWSSCGTRPAASNCTRFAAPATASDSVAFSPDSRRLAAAGQDTLVRVWDLQTAAELEPLSGPSGAVTQSGLQPDPARRRERRRQSVPVEYAGRRGPGRAVRTYVICDERRVLAGRRDPGGGRRR